MDMEFLYPMFLFINLLVWTIVRTVAHNKARHYDEPWLITIFGGVIFVLAVWFSLAALVVYGITQSILNRKKEKEEK